MDSKRKRERSKSADKKRKRSSSSDLSDFGGPSTSTRVARKPRATISNFSDKPPEEVKPKMST
jgi:hypothetical protein